MAINTLTQFRWKSNFHKVCWEKIKEMKPDLPRWTWDELVKYGWSIRISPTNPRADIDLIHTDGTFISFRLSINGQIMPHVEAMVFRLFGIQSTSCTRAESNLIFPQLQNFPGFVATKSSTWITISLQNAAGKDAFLNQIRPTPLDNTYAYPSITTSERFIRDVIRAPGSISLRISG